MPSSGGHDTVTRALPPPPFLQVSQWADIPRLAHGFCGRRGGESQGVFAELNLSFEVGDLPTAVQANWRRLSACVAGALSFTTMRQVHGCDVVTVSQGTTDAGEADALLTTDSAVALSILTADCVPILLVAPQHHAVAAVHAGWRGTLAGVAARALHALEQQYGARPHHVRASLGPAIGRCCYEVDATIVDQLQAR